MSLSGTRDIARAVRVPVMQWQLGTEAEPYTLRALPIHFDPLVAAERVRSAIRELGDPSLSLSVVHRRPIAPPELVDALVHRWREGLECDLLIDAAGSTTLLSVGREPVPGMHMHGARVRLEGDGFAFLYIGSAGKTPSPAQLPRLSRPMLELILDLATFEPDAASPQSPREH